MHESRRTHGNILLGLILVVLGIIFLVNQISSFDYDFGEFLAKWWPMILIIIGLRKITTPGEPRFGGGFIIFIIGLFFQLINLDILRWHYINYLWPLILILIGLRFLFGGRHNPFASESSVAEDRLDSVAIFGGSELAVSSQNFQGGQATAMFGGVDINLQGAKLSPDGAVLHASAIFGGVEIRVPPQWRVKTEGTPIFGSLENKCAAPTAADAPQLTVKGSAVFGGVEVKN